MRRLSSHALISFSIHAIPFPMLDRDIRTDAIRFWERGRIAYNAALLVVVGATTGPTYLAAMSAASWIGLLTLGVIANLLYCVAYPIDLFVQASAFRDVWRRRRWMLLAFGIVFAAALAWLTLLAMPLATVTLAG